MAEYFGYQAPTRIDWGAINKELQGVVEGIETKREERRILNEKVYSDLTKSIESTEPLKNQSAEAFVGSTASTVRDEQLRLKRDWQAGKIKGRDYRNIINNMNSSWGTFAQTAKGLDERVTAIMQRQQQGENGEPPQGSSAEAFITGEILSMKDFNNKVGKVGENGDLYIQDTTDPSNIFNLRTVGSIDNFVDNRIDVPSAVQNTAKQWGEWVVQEANSRGEEVKIEDLRKNPEYSKASQDLVWSIANPKNPRGIVGVLVDNSSEDYKFYRTDKQKAEIIAEEIKKKEQMLGKEMSEAERIAFSEDLLKNKMIGWEMDGNGEFQPIINDDMVTKAQDVVRRQIESQVDRSVIESAGYAPNRGSGGGSGSGSGDDTSYDLYPKLNEAWRLGKSNPSASASTLSSLTKGKYTFKWEKGGLAIYKGIANDDPDLLSLEPNSKIATVKSLEDAAQYFYGYTEAKGIGGAISKFKEERSRYKANNPNSNTSGELDQ
jgi:hypothetical protein